MSFPSGRRVLTASSGALRPAIAAATQGQGFRTESGP